jgi:hypothetical protein
MDPQYSVLIGDENGACGQDDGESTHVVAIVIPVVVGSIFLIGLAVFFAPR